MRQIESAASTLPPLESNELQEQVAARTPDAINLAHGIVRVPHAPFPVPYTVSVAETLVDNRVRFVVPGFSGFKKSSRKERNALAGEQGQIAVSYDPSRFGGPVGDIANPQRLHADTIYAISQDLPNNQELATIKNGTVIDFSSFSLLPHSMGGLSATIVGLEHSDEVDAIIYKSAVGLEQADKLRRLRFIGRIIKSLPNEINPAIKNGEFGECFAENEVTRRALVYLLSNPLRTGGEIVSCFRADNLKALDVLRSTGVKTGMLLFENDILIPAEDSYKYCGNKVDACKRLPDLDHLAPQTKADIVAREEVAMLHRLEC